MEQQLLHITESEESLLLYEKAPAVYFIIIGISVLVILLISIFFYGSVSVRADRDSNTAELIVSGLFGEKERFSAALSDVQGISVFENVQRTQSGGLAGSVRSYGFAFRLRDGSFIGSEKYKKTVFSQRNFASRFEAFLSNPSQAQYADKLTLLGIGSVISGGVALTLAVLMTAAFFLTGRANFSFDKKAETFHFQRKGLVAALDRKGNFSDIKALELQVPEKNSEMLRLVFLFREGENIKLSESYPDADRDKSIEKYRRFGKSVSEKTGIPFR